MTTITVVNSGTGSYTINGVESNPTISLVRGNTYNLVINASGHPFWIQTVSGAYSSSNIYSSGVTNNGSQSDTITFVVPNDAPNTLYYACEFHSSMQGMITITDPASPTITNFSIPILTYSNGATFTIFPPTSNSAGAFSYASADTNIATISGSIINILQAGTTTITATQSANGNFTSGTVTTILRINEPKYDGNIIAKYCANSTCEKSLVQKDAKRADTSGNSTQISKAMRYSQYVRKY